MPIMEEEKKAIPAYHFEEENDSIQVIKQKEQAEDSSGLNATQQVNRPVVVLHHIFCQMVICSLLLLSIYILKYAGLGHDFNKQIKEEITKSIEIEDVKELISEMVEVVSNYKR